jgi:hypothetical protein
MMYRFRKNVGFVLAAMACVALAAPPAMASHIVKFGEHVVLPGIDEVGGPDFYLGNAAHAKVKVNTKKFTANVKASGHVYNLSGRKFKEKLTADLFGLDGRLKGSYKVSKGNRNSGIAKANLSAKGDVDTLLDLLDQFSPYYT